MESHIHIYSDGETVAQSFAHWLESWVAQHPEGPLHIALSGGSTPKRLFQILAEDYAEKLPWERLHFWWGDERCVPPTDEESNYHMTKETLIGKISVPGENIHRIMGEADDILAEADRYASEIKSALPEVEGMPQFDLVMLGMGDDGHTASIFPNSLFLLEEEQLVAKATHPASGQIRLTLTGNILSHAKTVAFLVTGPRKAGRVAQILGGRPGARKLPAYHIKPKEGVLHWFLDGPAAADLRG